MSEPAAGSWLELRVHGVSGTPVEDLLSRPGSPAIRGANIEELPNGQSPGQFWQRTDIAEPHELQAYHWGEYTSRFSWQALWVLLLPFGIINTSQFMLPTPTSTVQKLLHALAGSCLRVIGLALSALAFLSMALITLDLVGWYAIGRRTGEHYAAIGLLALLLAAVLGLIGRLSRQRQSGRSPGSDSDGSASGLHQERFYTGLVRSPDARRLHSAAILAMLSILTAWPGAEEGGPGLRLPLRLAETLLLVVTAVVAVSGDPEGGSSVQLTDQLDTAVRWLQARVLKLVSLLSWLGSIALLLWTVWQARLSSPRQMPVETLPGFDNVAAWLLIGSLGSLAVLLVAVLPLALLSRVSPSDDRARAFNRYAGGLGTWFMAAVGVFVGVGFAGALAILPAAGNGLWNWALHHHGGFHVPFPAILRRVLYAWGWTVLIALVAGLVLVADYRIRLRARYRAAAGLGYQDFGEPPAAMVARVALRTYCARLKNLIPQLAIGFGSSGVLLSIAAGAVTFDWPGSRSAVARTLAGSAGGWVVDLQVLGLTALTGLVLGLGIFTYLSYRSDSSRRTLNIVWDVICFWPRSVHPLTPTAYSQFVVAELCDRVRLELQQRRVVIAAHSQGSLISFAALLWLSDDERSRVGFLSFGSQLRQMYPRAFPGYVNSDVLGQVRDGLADRWTNLYRDTDHIAGPLFSWAHYRTRGENPPQAASWPKQARTADLAGAHGRRVNGPDWRLLDPELAANDQLPAADARSQNHSNYWLDNSWDDAIASVLPPG
jgi:hypothetical protein